MCAYIKYMCAYILHATVCCIKLRFWVVPVYCGSYKFIKYSELTKYIHTKFIICANIILYVIHVI